MSKPLSKAEEMRKKIKGQQKDQPASKGLFGDGEDQGSEEGSESSAAIVNNDQSQSTSVINIDGILEAEKKYAKNKPKPVNPNKMIGIYFEPAVYEMIKNKNREFGKGWQSDIGNELFKQYFKNKGWM